MYLKHLSLANYRNYTRLELDLQARIHVLQGENAQGKTNLLESIYYLATTKSPLASAERQIMNWDAEREVIPYTRVRGVFARGGDEHTIEITLAKQSQSESNGETGWRRQIHFDGAPRRAIEVVGRLNAVLFLPEDIVIISGPPGERRRYLDIALCQIDGVYCRTLARYNHIIEQRNALLKQIRERQARPTELDYWDEQAAILGGAVLARRLWAIRELGRDAGALLPTLTGEREHLALAYQHSLETYLDEAAKPSLAALDPSDHTRLADLFRQALRNARRDEQSRAVTLIGPHRDDLRFLINGIDATTYGSRGQQRTTVLALKLAEVALMHRETGEMPLLLLDDVISELDLMRSHYLLETISRAQQVLITTTDLGDYAREFLGDAILWRVAAGTITLIEAESRGT